MKAMVLGFGILIASLLILFKLAEYSYLRSGAGTEVWIAVISLVFFGIGIFISRKYLPAKETKKEGLDLKQVDKVGLSKREYEILQLINEGLSNQQIVMAVTVFLIGLIIAVISSLILRRSGRTAMA